MQTRKGQEGSTGSTGRVPQFASKAETRRWTADSVALLLRAGADPLLTDSIGRLPLHYAVEVDLEHQVRGQLPTQ